MSRPRIAVVHPYWSLWEHTAGPTFRADRLALALDICEATRGNQAKALVGKIAKDADPAARSGRACQSSETTGPGSEAEAAASWGAMPRDRARWRGHRSVWTPRGGTFDFFIIPFSPDS